MINPRLRMRGALAGAVVALTFALTWSLVKVPTLEDSAARSESKASTALTKVEDLEKQVDANKAALSQANGRLIALGAKPVPQPKVTSTPPPQPDEFTADEAAAVRVIVADMIARTPAQITQAEVTQIARVASAFVPKPKDGKTPTVAELTPIVKVVLAQYCTGDKCVGQRGQKGDKGDPAPAVTDEQLLAAAAQSLVAYCGQESKPCTPKDGVDGKDAPPPYSVVDTDCVGDGDQSVWKTYLSNGTDQKVLTTRGPCRIGPDPD
jgi:hypothetical protein